MAEIKQDNTIFNVSSDVIFTAGGKYANSSNADASGNKFDAEYFAENPNDLSKSFNAIEIDWNGAKINNITLNNTGQLISIIKDLHSRISVLESKLNNSGGSTPEVTPSDTPSDTPSASPSASPSNTPSST